MRAVLLSVLALALIGAPDAQAFLGLFGSSIENAVAKDGLVAVNVSSLKSGQSKHYQYQEGKTLIRFFVVRDNQGTVRAALDACEECWKADKGYTLEGQAMLCVNCGRKFALSSIGFARGGCNPHPVVFRMDGENLTVATQELSTGSRYFPRNAR